MNVTSDPHLRSLAQLAFLAPDIQEAILEGRQPVLLALKDLRLQKLPFSWQAKQGCCQSNANLSPLQAA